MLQSTFRSVLLATLFASALLADDPFVGKWKLNLGKSRLTGQTIEIQEASGNGFIFREDQHSDIIFADGLDHPTHFGETMAITQKKKDVWEITYKRGDRVLMDTTWTLSPDGQTLTYVASGTRPNGLKFKNEMTAKRTGGTAGLAGTWETTGVTLSSPREIYIEPYGPNGQFITFPGRRQTIRIKYDGKEYTEEGPAVAEGSTSSGHRLDAKTIETTEKIKGRVVETTRATISSDGSTQTLVVTEPGDPTPVILVYEREPK